MVFVVFPYGALLELNCNKSVLFFFLSFKIELIHFKGDVQAMTKEQVLEKLMFDVELRGLSKNTKDEYYLRIKSYQNHYDKPATELGEEDIRLFLHYLTTERKLASGSVNTYNSALRFLYGVTLNTKLNLRQIPRHLYQRGNPSPFCFL